MRWIVALTVVLGLVLMVSCNSDKAGVGNDPTSGEVTEVASGAMTETTVEPDDCKPWCLKPGVEFPLTCLVSDGCGGSCECPSTHKCVDDDTGPPFCFDFDEDCKKICAGEWGPGLGAECGLLEAFLINSASDETHCYCGDCPSGQVCIDEDGYFGGHCCTPDCKDRECGNDACGGNCGGCAGTERCTAGICENSEQMCIELCAEEGLECGTNFIDDYGECDCGDCPEGYECVTMSCVHDSGTCFSYEIDCPIICADVLAECGEVSTAIAMDSPICDCGTCPEGEVCVDNEPIEGVEGGHCEVQ